ncbi:MAG: hypothetical protein ACI9WC_001994 [Arenicella sp.]
MLIKPPSVRSHLNGYEYYIAAGRRKHSTTKRSI